MTHNSAPTLAGAVSCATGAPNTTKFVPGSVWNTVISVKAGRSTGGTELIWINCR